jgi:hypothetical protein
LFVKTVTFGGLDLLVDQLSQIKDLRARLRQLVSGMQLEQMCGIRDARRVAKALELFIADEPSAVAGLVSCYFLHSPRCLKRVLCV